MKKALARTLLIALSIVIIAGVIPLSANASSSSNNKTTIFKYLTEELGFNSAAACGIMANIEKESSFRSNVIIRDSNGLPSGGLCMWNGSRLTNLKNFCAKKGLNYLSIEGQLSYLDYELQKDQYKHIYKYLKNVSNSSKGAYNAAHYWCYYFEIPANRGSKSVQRGNSATKSYWPVYGDIELKKPKLTVAKGTTYEPGKALTVNWTSAGNDADGYKVYLVKKNAETGKYDYDNAKVAKLDSDGRSFTIKAHNMKIGSCKVYVYAYHNATGLEKKSNVLDIKIKCPDHDYETKVTSLPTDKKDGVKTLTCKTCGEVKKQAYTLSQYIPTLKVKNVTIEDLTDSTLKIKWNDLKYADGYCVYAKISDKWQKIATTTSERKEISVKNLDPEREYSFRVKAFIDEDGKQTFTKYSKTTTVVTEAAPAQEQSETSTAELTELIKEFYGGLLKN